MLAANVWRRALGVDRATVIEEIDFDEESDTVVVHVRPRRSTKRRCGRCAARSPNYDQGEGRRNWRALDLGTLRCFLQADSPRVDCLEHGPTVAQVPWARHAAGHTRDFDDQVAWLVTHAPKSTVAELMRVAWRTVGSIIERVVADARSAHDPFEGLTRIGIDEISYKRGHRYLTICVDHDSGRLIWAAVGRDRETLGGFFDLLGEQRCQGIRLVSADAAPWIAEVVAQRCKNATLCIDSFHVVAWATKALDEVRREVWNEARKGGMSGHARALKGCRYALWPSRGPERAPGAQARLDREGEHQALPRLPDERAAAHRHQDQGQTCHLDAQEVARLDAALPDPRVRRARPHDRAQPCRHRSRDAAQAFERARRVDEHEAPGAAPDGIRLPQARAPDRAGAPGPRWLLPAATRARCRVIDPRKRQESQKSERRLNASERLRESNRGGEMGSDRV